MIGHLQLDPCLWVSDQIRADRHCVLPPDANQYLGFEFSALVYDSFVGLNANALAALSGTIVGGGFLFWLTPALDQWPAFDDPDYSRFISYPYQVADVKGGFLSRLSFCLQQHADCYLIRQGKHWPKISRQAVLPLVNWAGKTPDQEKAIAAIEVVAFGHRRRPLVLTADRGRGKSAALGMAVTNLFERGLRRIALTAPSILSVEAVYQHALQQMPQAKRRGAKLLLAGKVLLYLPPDELLRLRPEADCLLVDEAASIPTPLLQELLAIYSRIVFVTTCDGYEGTGRGFALRFEPWLSKQVPQWRKLTLETPIRWAAHDPLERLLYQLLLLKSGHCKRQIGPGHVFRRIVDYNRSVRPSWQRMKRHYSS